jgi:hypothetical protein
MSVKREENRFRASENRMLRRTFGSEREAGEDCIMRSFITCAFHQLLLG